MDGFQTRLTGLTTDEAESLFLVGQPEVAHRLGLGVPARATRNKLLNAIAPMLAAEADQLASWFLHDPDPPEGHGIPHGELRRLGRSIKRCHKVELFFAQEAGISVQPLGLVLKAGSWNLVVMGKRHVEVLCIDQLRATRLTNESFVRPPDFNLNEFWRSADQRLSVRVTSSIRTPSSARSMKLSKTSPPSGPPGRSTRR